MTPDKFGEWLSMAFVAAFGVLVIAIFVLALAPKTPVAAAPEETPACEAIAHAGALLIFRCEDEETGTVIYANNIGMMVVEP